MNSRGFVFEKKGVGKLIDISLFLMLLTSILVTTYYKFGGDELKLIENRVRKEYSFRMLSSVLQYKIRRFGNMSSAEAIERYFCEGKPSKTEVISELQSAFDKVRGDFDYILDINSGKEQLLLYSYKPSICLERITLSKIILTTPCGEELNLTLGIFSRFEEVEKC